MNQHISKEMRKSLERVVSAIRDYDAILWAGSGLSLYAGYPSGSELSEIILEAAKSKEDKAILERYKNSLMDMSNEFSHLYSRDKLLEILKANFDLPPSVEPSIHRLIAKIPQICSIITTNYDHLFETVYENRITVYTGTSFNRTVKGSIDLYKIHGDTSAPDSIVLTSTDYSQFYDRLDTILWNKIKWLLAEKTVVFVGYSLEDKNIQDVFEKIVRQITPSDKEFFIVTPTMEAHKLRHLNTICRTTHIPLTGEEFFEYIEAEIRKNILHDAAAKKISVDEAYKICREHGITLTIVNEPHGDTTKTVVDKIKLSPSLYSDQAIRPFNRGINFFSRPETLESMRDFIDDCDRTEVIIPADDAVLYQEISGIQIPENYKYNGQSPSVVMIVKRETVENFELRLDSHKVTSCQVRVKSLFGDKKKRLVVEMPCISMNILYLNNRTDFQFSFRYPHTTATALADFERLQLWASGVAFTFYQSKQSQTFSLKGLDRNDSAERLATYIDRHIRLYQSIAKLEEDLHDRFTIQEELTSEDLKKINLACASLTPRTIKYDGTFNAKYKSMPQANLDIFDNPESIATMQISYIEDLPENYFELFGKSLSLGLRKVSLVDPYISNMSAAKKAALAKEDIILQFASKKGEAILEYINLPIEGEAELEPSH